MKLTYKDIELVKKEEREEEISSQAWHIYKDGVIIGEVDSYFIDYEYKPIRRKEESTDNKCIRINISDSENWDKGYGTKALVAFIEYLFEEKQYRLLYAQTSSDNQRIEHVLKNLGFRVVSRLKDEVLVGSKIYDFLSLKLIPHNFKSAKKRIEQGE
ncbi:MAG: GNAT family N-acetyltransferase [Tissierellia bacterium]|nr:GNAT family N-acetyltransferase [Tissierellia bacterium]